MTTRKKGAKKPATKAAKREFDPERIETQAQLDAAIEAKAPRIVIVGGTLSSPLEAGGSAHVEARGSAHVVAWGSAHVVAWGSAHVEARESAHVEARESAHVEAGGSAHVEARGSAHVVAWGSAHVEARGSAHVEARESAHVVAWASAHVEAGQFVSVHKMLGHSGDIEGGVVIAQPATTTAEDWCAYHGVVVTNGVAIVYKALNDDYSSPHGQSYTPGTSPEAKDWGGRECGGGFHFSPSPSMARDFHETAKRFAACPVALADMRAPQQGDAYPQKVKARRVCGPIVEVDMFGKAVG